MKTIILSIGLLISFMSLSAQDATEIIKKSHEIMKLNSFEATSRLVIYDGKGNERVRNNTMASKTYGDGTEKRVIRFLSPAEVKGTGILIFDHETSDDDMWIYLPALRKTRRIVSSEKSKGFMGSEFSNADMTAPALEDFKYELLGSEEIEAVACWKVSSTAVNMDIEDEYGYSQVISWIGKNDYLVRQRHYLDFDQEHFKTIRTLAFKQFKDKYMITEMIAENHSNGRSSRMKMEEIQISDTDDDYFTVAYLEK